MQVNLTAKDLIAFEDEIAGLFLDKQIHAPVHLAGGNEEALIRIFQEHVQPEDWVLCSWRSHYHCLLKGVPPEQVKREILAGRSISLCFPEYKVLSSGIVGGIAPIAVGLGMAIKRKLEAASKGRLSYPHEYRKVVCFLGDMSAETGGVWEAVKYVYAHDLPVLFVVEDNGLSVGTKTVETWGGVYPLGTTVMKEKVVRYRYTLTRPHVGVGKHVAF